MAEQTYTLTEAQLRAFAEEAVRDALSSRPQVSEAPKPSSNAPKCTKCGRAVQPPFLAYCSYECKHGRPKPTGFVRQRIREGKANTEATHAANLAHAQGVVAALEAVRTKATQAGAEVRVHANTSGLYVALNDVQKPLPGERKRVPDFRTHTSTLTFDSPKRAGAFVSAFVAAGGEAEVL